MSIITRRALINRPSDIREGLVFEYLLKGNVLDSSAHDWGAITPASSTTGTITPTADYTTFTMSSNAAGQFYTPDALNTYAFNNWANLTTFSISVWESHSSGWFYLMGGSGNYFLVQTGTNYTYATAYTSNSGGSLLATNYMSTSPTSNTWRHYVLTCDGSTLTTYLNGVKAAEVRGTAYVYPIYHSSAYALRYFCYIAKQSGAQSINVKLARMWGRTITEEEISTLYAEGL